MTRRRDTVIRHGAAQLESARQLLRMLAFHTRSWREIWRAARDEVELLICPHNTRRAEIAVTDLITVGEPVVTRRFFRQPNAFRLCLDGDKTRAGQTPGANHPNRPDAAAKIESRPRRRTPTGAIPRGQDVI